MAETLSFNSFSSVLGMISLNLLPTPELFHKNASEERSLGLHGHSDVHKNVRAQVSISIMNGVCREVAAFIGRGVAKSQHYSSRLLK